jgi:hypothetical protein
MFPFFVCCCVFLGFGFGFGFFVSAQHCVWTHFAAAFVLFYVLSCNALVALFILFCFAPALAVAIPARLITLDTQSHLSSPAFCLCNFAASCAHTLSQVGKLAPTWKYVSSTASAMVA